MDALLSRDIVEDEIISVLTASQRLEIIGQPLAIGHQRARVGHGEVGPQRVHQVRGRVKAETMKNFVMNSV